MGSCRLRHAWLAGLAVICLAPTGAVRAAPDGRPRPIEYLGSLSDHSPGAPAPGQEPWMPADVVDLLAARPRASIAVGRDEGPPGSVVPIERRAQLERIRARAATAGVEVASRLCVPLRVDVARKLRPGHPRCAASGCDWEGDMDGSHGERESVVKARGHASGAGAASLRDAAASWRRDGWARRLLVLRPGTALEEQRRITENDGATLSVASPWRTPPRPGDAYEIRGSFDPAWVLRVPADAHAATVRRLWSERRDVCGPSGRMPCAPPAEPLDPLAPGNARGWRADLDRPAIAALANSAGVPALFGTIRDADRRVAYLTDPYPTVESVAMDVREPGYRAWRARAALYALEDHGVAPGTPACVILGYEPAAFAHYDAASEGPSRHRCALPDTSSWQAPLHVCHEARHAGGPLAATGYGPAEYEAGISALVRELLATLAASGYSDVRVVTAEGEALRGRPWTALAADLRLDARLAGALDAARAPRLAEIAGAAAALAAADDASGGGGGAARDAAGAPTRGRTPGPATPRVAEARAPAPEAPGEPQPRTRADAAQGGRADGGVRDRSGAAGAAPAASPETREPRTRRTTSWTVGAGAGGRSSSGPAPRAVASGGSATGDGNFRKVSTADAGAGAREGNFRKVSTADSGAGAREGNFRKVSTADSGAGAPAVPPRPVIQVEPTPPRTPTNGGGTTPTASPTPTPSRGSSVERPNEPAGMTARQPMNPMNDLPPTHPAAPDRYGFKCWEDQCRTLSIVNDPTSPGRDPEVLRVGYPRGHPGGHPPSRFLAGNDFGGKRRLYTSVYYKLSPNWTNAGNAGTKFVFFRPRIDGVQNHFLLGPAWDAPFRTGFSLQTPDGAGNRNIVGGTLPVGRWVHLEMLVEMNTPGRADGVGKLWIDGNLVVAASDVRWVPALRSGQSLRDVSWDYLWVDPTYGGGTHPVPEDMYFQVDDWYTSVGD